MRAVAIASDRSLQVVDIDRPVPGAGEVLLDVSFCGICGSDLHMLQMPAEMIPAGHVLGHEFTGAIAALGPSVGQWDVGERVAVVPMVPCGACYACRIGRPNLCENGIDRGPGIGRQGAYAESVTVPVGMLRRLPPAISDADGALIEPLAVAIRAISQSGATPHGVPHLHRPGLRRSMEHIAAGRIPCGQVATTKAPLEHASRWFADLSSGATQQVKVLLSPRPGGPSSAAA